MRIDGTTATTATTAPASPKDPKPNQGKWMAPAAGDTLTIRVQQGDTKFALARRYANDANHDGKIAGTELSSFFASLDKANGGNTVLKLGDTVKLPSDNVDYKVKMAIACQKWLSEPTTTKEVAATEYDWTKVTVGNGPLESFIVDVPSRDGASTQRFLVDEDMEGESDALRVQLFSDFVKDYPELFQ